MGKVQRLADYFGIGKTALIDEMPSDALTSRDTRDIEKILNQTRDQLLSQEGLMFDGKPASPEAIESILSAMQVGMELAKKKNKENGKWKAYSNKNPTDHKKQIKSRIKHFSLPLFCYCCTFIKRDTSFRICFPPGNSSISCGVTARSTSSSTK